MVPCGPDAKGISARRRDPCAPDRRGPHARRRAGTSTSSCWTRPPGAVPGAAATVTPSGEPSVAATQAGAAPTVTVQSVHIDTETAKVTGATVALRARPGPEHQLGLAGRRQPRSGRPGRVARGQSGHAAAHRQLRQRLGRHPVRPAGVSVAGGLVRGQPGLDAPTRGLGRARPLGGHAGALPACWGSCPSGGGGGCGGGGELGVNGSGARRRAAGGSRGRRVDGIGGGRLRGDGSGGRPWRRAGGGGERATVPAPAPARVPPPRATVTGCAGGTPSSSA